MSRAEREAAERSLAEQVAWAVARASTRHGGREFRDKVQWLAPVIDRALAPERAKVRRLLDAARELLLAYRRLSFGAMEVRDDAVERGMLYLDGALFAFEGEHPIFDESEE